MANNLLMCSCPSESLPEPEARGFAHAMLSPRKEEARSVIHTNQVPVMPYSPKVPRL